MDGVYIQTDDDLFERAELNLKSSNLRKELFRGQY